MLRTCSTLSVMPWMTSLLSLKKVQNNRENESKKIALLTQC